MRTPSFWYDDFGVKAALAYPLSLLYRGLRALHVACSRPKRLGVRSLCLGNITAGGAGKTPAAQAIMQLIQDHNIAAQPAFLSRGYGASLQGPVRVDASIHQSRHVGEEPLLLAKHAPAYVSADRFSGADYAQAEGVDFLILDDGLQNPKLQADLSLLVVDGMMGFGNGCLLPTGPLREPLEQCLKRIDAVLIIGDDKAGISAQLPHDLPVFNLRPQLSLPASFNTDQPFFAFAGIGYPPKFYKGLRDDLQLNIVRTEDYPDHYRYSQADLDDLRARAKARGAQLITTEKDYMHLKDLSYHEDVLVAGLTLNFQQEENFISFLKQRAMVGTS